MSPCQKKQIPEALGVQMKERTFQTVKRIFEVQLFGGRFCC